MMTQDLVQSELGGRLRYFPVVEKPDPSWVYGEGDLSSKLLEDFMPSSHLEDSHVMICGDKNF